MDTPSVQTLLANVKTIPVLNFKSAEEAVDTCGVLIESGLSVLELTLRHPSALDNLTAVKDAYGDKAKVGMGTITSVKQLQEVQARGADFGVSPGLTDELATAIGEAKLPFLPGIATVSEAMRARDYGFDVLKFFPAEQSGGTGFLKGVGAVLPELQFCPTGGLNANNAGSYLALDNVICFGASALTSRDALGNINPDAVHEAIRKFKSFNLI